MSKLLIIDDEPEVRMILRMILESKFDFEIVEIESGNKAVKALKDFDDVVGIISDYNMPDGKGDVIYSYNEIKDNLPFIMISGGLLEGYSSLKGFLDPGKRNIFLDKPIDFNSLVGHVTNLFSNSSLNRKYDKVNSKIMKIYPPDNFEVMLRLSSEKYLPIKNKGDSNYSDIERYEEKTDNYFYMKRSDFKEYIGEVLVMHYAKLVQKSGSIDKVVLCGHSLDILKESLTALDVGQKQIELINVTIENCLNEVFENKKMKDKVEVFLQSSGYFVAHSITSIQIACVLARDIGIGEELVNKKIAFAGLLHDIGLKDSHEHSIFQDLESDDYSKLDRLTQKDIKSHPSTSSKVFDEYLIVPSDSQQMIKEHHEYPLGGGFPLGIKAAKMSQLSILFSFSIVVSDHLFKKGNDFDSLCTLIDKLEALGFNEKKASKIFDAFKKRAID